MPFPWALVRSSVDHGDAQAVEEVVGVAVRVLTMASKVNIFAGNRLVPEPACQVAGGELVFSTVDEHAVATRRSSNTRHLVRRR